eukprot:TRINITY_DN4696_c0_g1_i1.p1 TRINITY_DN4696_c0_g1~~TRINITY_DN4696_c0_g1_i1.p1  ORF type:complete len:537 (+),score=186.44 TRINITY_DN4696_c0_g1_i1:66-1676(+)
MENNELEENEEYDHEDYELDDEDEEYANEFEEYENQFYKDEYQISKLQSLTEKYDKFVHLDKLELPNKVENVIKVHEKKQELNRYRIKDKSHRATTEQVMDDRTRIILFKLLNGGAIDEVLGCISTGKEANVYYASNKDGQEFGVKIYKTSILVFKDRDKYVTGEFRFRTGYSKHNPRKMVKVWAEKEFRNLSRLKKIDIRCPQPFVVRQHVLLMELIGKDGVAAPRLKDASFNTKRAIKLYYECVVDVRNIFQKAKLVHADLSEYNILYWKKKLYYIDVSQSVEHEHPNALEFLRKDCENINIFFKKHGVKVMTTKQLFDFVVDPTIEDSLIQPYLEKIKEFIEKRGDMTNEEIVEEEVFKNVFIPRSLGQVVDFEKDYHLLVSEKKVPVYNIITGMGSDFSGPISVPDLLSNSSSDPKNTSDTTSDVTSDLTSDLINTSNPSSVSFASDSSDTSNDKFIKPTKSSKTSSKNKSKVSNKPITSSSTSLGTKSSSDEKSNLKSNLKKTNDKEKKEVKKVSFSEKKPSSSNPSLDQD